MAEGWGLVGEADAAKKFLDLYSTIHVGPSATPVRRRAHALPQLRKSRANMPFSARHRGEPSSGAPNEPTSSSKQMTAWRYPFATRAPALWPASTMLEGRAAILLRALELPPPGKRTEWRNASQGQGHPMKPVIACSVFLLVCCPNAAAQPVAPSPTGLHLVEAVQSAISRHPGLELQRQEVEIGNAVHQQASGVFDQLFAASVNHGRLYGPFGGLSGFTLAPNDSSQVLASYSKLLRSGISIGGSVDLLRQVDNGGLLGGLSTSTTRLNMVVPLMRGRGTEVTTANVRAAGLQRDSSVLELRHLTATLMTRVVSSYWALVAAGRFREVAAESAARGARLVDNTRALIDADVSPRSDLASVLANAADRESARFVSEQAYVEARQQLWLDMGNTGTDSHGHHRAR